MQKEIDKTVLNRVNKWLEGNYDATTKKQIKELLSTNPDELIDSFYTDLEFGTGGLRGIMGVGTNRMNQYTVAMATQGFANYLLKNHPKENNLKVAIAYDSRNNSKAFAKITANVFSANGFYVYLFSDIRPTPELSFAIRFLGCCGGVVVTASHNPKEYNGYKAYWSDGGQLIAPHDKNVIAEVTKIKSIDEVKLTPNKNLIKIIGADIDKAYLKEVKALSLTPKLNKKHRFLKIVYTPIHGTGYKLVPKILEKFGFDNMFSVNEQFKPDGNFPTVKSPNPEESEALSKALYLADLVDADLVLATDPDADRVGIAVKDNNNKFVLLNGNQTAVILLSYILEKWKELKKFKGNEFIVKTIVTTEMLKEMADYYKVECPDVLTGFKFIADIILQYEGKKQFIAGGEESYGYLVGDFVRDKDAVSACAMISEACANAIENNKTLFDILIDAYIKFGFYKEHLLSITKKSKDGLEEIKQMMTDYRTKPPTEINKSKVVMIKDYLTQTETNIENKTTKPIALPKSDVIQFFTADGSKVTVRPSGTEPKIKFYFGVKTTLKSKAEFDNTNSKLDQKIKDIIKSLKLV